MRCPPACVVCGYEVADAGCPLETAASPPGPTELDARRELAREFRIEALIAPGPPHITYLASDPQQDRQVLLKVAPRGPLPEDRFRRALESAGALNHPHIVPIYRGGTTASFLWYATELIEGRSLETMVRTDPMDLAHCLRILEQVASALDYAHRRGVFHGALVPASVIVDANQWALVGDFAVADVMAAGRPTAQLFHARGPTPGADQCALAALVYQCLSGMAPAGDTPAHLSDVRPEIPRHVSDALERALSSRPAVRFPSVLDFVAAVEGAASGAGQRPPLTSLNPRGGPGLAKVITEFEFEPRPARGRGLSAPPAAPAIENHMGRPAPSPVTSAPDPPPPASAPPPASVQPEREPAAPAPRVARPAAARVHRAAPAPSPSRRATKPAPPPASPAPPASMARRVELGHVSINAIPWGRAYVDGQLVGTVPLIDVPIRPGTHALRVEREGFHPYERRFEIGSGQRLKITDIVLRELAP
ncbi:MAG: hypothetical protein AUH12_04315 [Gemmatimonadetes bacterium 13_2_20CM_69_8]|nr:MAG: hypothetical protein AUH12_04315 [Gemmatimonadetes bacterium 13_2_20CM_69_8]